MLWQRKHAKFERFYLGLAAQGHTPAPLREKPDVGKQIASLSWHFFRMRHSTLPGAFAPTPMTAEHVLHHAWIHGEPEPQRFARIMLEVDGAFLASIAEENDSA